MTKTLESLLALRGRRLVIIGHVNPDGDSVGSALGLALMLRAAGAEPRVVFPSPLPRRLLPLASLGGVPVDCLDDAARPGELLAADEIALAVDVASPAQLGALAPLCDRIALMIDHHGTGTPFAPGLVVPDAAAAGEVLWGLYREAVSLGALPELPDVGRLLWAAVASDTGSFQYSNTSPATMAAAGEMISLVRRDPAGPDVPTLGRWLFASVPFGSLKGDGLAALNTRVFCGGRLAATLITAEEMNRLGLTPEDLSGAVEAPRSLSGAEIALCLKQSPDKPQEFRVSSRSNGEANVASVAARFGGGGHAKAAGCTLSADSPEEALRLAVEAFSEALPGGGQP